MKVTKTDVVEKHVQIDLTIEEATCLRVALAGACSNHSLAYDTRKVVERLYEKMLFTAREISEDEKQ